jgi:hypothetical protein
MLLTFAKVAIPKNETKPTKGCKTQAVQKTEN